MFHHDSIGGINLCNAGIEATDSTRYLRILQHDLRVQLIKTSLADKQLIVSKIIGLHDVYLLLYLLGDLNDLVFITPCGDGVFMHTLNARGRYVQALDVHLTTSKHSSNLV